MSRFLQTDPKGHIDSMNLYQGMGINTMNFVDPFGVKINYFIKIVENATCVYYNVYRRLE